MSNIGDDISLTIDDVSPQKDSEQTLPLFDGLILTDPDASTLPVGKPFRLRYSGFDAPISTIEIQCSLLDSSAESQKGWTIISDWQPLENFSVSVDTKGPKALQIKVSCEDGREQVIWLGNYFFYDKHETVYLPDIIHSITSIAPHALTFDEELAFVGNHLFLLFIVIFDSPEATDKLGYYAFEDGTITARLGDLTATLDINNSLLKFEGLPVLFDTNGLDVLRGLREQVFESLGLNSWDALYAIASMMLVRRAYRFSKSGQNGVRSLAQDTVTCGGYSAILIGLLRCWGLTANAIGYTGSGRRVHVMVECKGPYASLILDPTTGVALAGTVNELKSGALLKRLDLNLGIDLGYDVVEDFRTRDTEIILDDINFIKLIPV